MKGQHPDIHGTLILAKTAHSETVAFFRGNAFSSGNAFLRKDIEYAKDLDLGVRATECLRLACANRDLRMIVIDPKTRTRREVPSEYFDQKFLAEIEFTNGLFLTSELSKKMVAAISRKIKKDPLLELVDIYQGWIHGFAETEFRVWLEDPSIGPQAGPRMRLFFHTDPRVNSSGDRPTQAEVNQWMRENVRYGVKRADALAACCQQTKATFRDAAAAFDLLPSHVKMKRGRRRVTPR